MKFVCAAALAAFLFAQCTYAGETAKPAALPEEVRSLVELAAAAPPEFAADALLRIAASGRVKDLDAQRKLVEAAFAYAAQSRNPVRLVRAGGSAADTRSAYRAAALRLGLDAITLQSRALEAMSALDKAAARDLFARMRAPAIETASCESALVPDLSAYYEAVTRLLLDVFTGADGEKNSRLAFAQVAVDRMKSHVEAAPVARLITSVQWTRAQFEILSGAYLARLQSLSQDDRSFSLAAGDIERAMTDLVAQARFYGTDGTRISEAYRAYLVANLTGPRCADRGASRELFGEAVRGESAPLGADDTKAGRGGGEAQDQSYWESAEARQIFEEGMALRQSSTGENLSAADRQSPEWRRKLTDFLNRLSNWKQTQEKSEEDYYHQRAIVYEALLELAPAGDVRNRVLEEYVGFLKGSNIQQANPVEWYWHAQSTLSRVKVSQPAEAERLLGAYAASGNIVLALEAALERMRPDAGRLRP